MDRRTFLRIGLLALAAPLAGCGRAAVPRDDLSDLPPEVKADEDALNARVQKSIAEREKQKQKQKAP